VTISLSESTTKSGA